MKREEILLVLENIMRNEIDYPILDEEVVNESTSFGNDLGLDSLDKVAILIQAEHHYDMEFTSFEETRVNTVGDMIDVFEKQLNA